jgi:hypothetical protein
VVLTWKCSRAIDSYIHAIHNSQQFDIANVDFADPRQAQKYTTDIELPYPKHGITNCEACHVAGAYDVPSQSSHCQASFPPLPLSRAKKGRLALYHPMSPGQLSLPVVLATAQP